MEIILHLEDAPEKTKKVLKMLDEMGVSYSGGPLSSKDVAFGIGRKATDEELTEYLDRCLNSELLDIDEVINED